MQAAYRTQTTVLPGHRIEIAAPEFPEGAQVEVIVVLPATASAPRSALEIIESLHGHRLFQTPQEVDQYIQQERDSWER
jgi:hypothetical protein